MDKEVFAALYLEQLQLNKQLKAKAYVQLLLYYGSAQAILALSKSELQAAGLKAVAASELYALLQCQLHPEYCQQVEQNIAYTSSTGIQLIPYAAAYYPQHLREIYQPPPLLYALGDLGLLEQNQFAIVGARKASQAGLDNARQFAAELAQSGWCINSGLALGVDGAAHQGALSVQGKTLAVLPCGIDLCYPARHRELAMQIQEQGGLLISEFALGSKALRNHFPRRNRLISGLSAGTLVVEAQLKSGSLITARLALEQNKEVFALPAGINNPYGQGCNQLIQQGAKLVTCVADIQAEFEGMNWLPFKQAESRQTSKPALPDTLTPLQQKLYITLLDQALSLEELLLTQEVSFAELQQNIMQLELLGLLRQEFGRYLAQQSC